jgi:hypothetical protein
LHSAHKLIDVILVDADFVLVANVTFEAEAITADRIVSGAVDVVTGVLHLLAQTVGDNSERDESVGIR